MELKKRKLFFPDQIKNGIGRLKLRVRYEGYKIDISAGFLIDEKKWVKDAQRCKINTTHGKDKIPADVINRVIQKMDNQIDFIFNEFERKDKIPTPEEIRTEYNKLNNQKQQKEVKTVIDYFDLFMDSGVNLWSIGTFAKLRVIRGHLLNFDEKMVLRSFDKKKITEYSDWLINDRAMRNTTVTKHIRIIRWFLKWCDEQGYDVDPVALKYKHKLKQSDKIIIFLTEEELGKVRNCNIPETKGYLDRVRDMFLFMVYTGVRYSDLANLKRINVQNDCISFTTKKTTDNLTISLNNRAKELIDKYIIYNFPNGKVFPVISNQKMNDYLKELGQLSELNDIVQQTYTIGSETKSTENQKWELLTCHVARRTFVSLSLSKNIPVSIIMGVTGHSSLSAMQPYAGLNKEQQKEELSKWDEEKNPEDELIEQLKALPKEKLRELLHKIST